MGWLRDWREWRAFRRLPAQERAIVFYSESGQDWHHLAPLIEQLTGPQGRAVCYLTSDPVDPGLSWSQERFHAFCIGAGTVRIVAFQFLRADLMVLTMMDLDNFQLKRSVHPVHYVYVFHSPASTHMVDRAESYDNYDSLLCVGPHQVRELRARETQADLAPRHLVRHGYPRLDALIAASRRRGEHVPGDPPVVLVAPTWGETATLNLCGERLLEVLLEGGLEVILRPHYETARRHPWVVDRLLERFGEHPRLRYVGRMGESGSLFDADLLITDWSGIGLEYPLGLARPVLYIDVPRRVRNPDYETLGLEPVEVSIRERVGEVLSPERIDEAPARVRGLLAERSRITERIEVLRAEYLFNIGCSAEVGAREIARIADHRAAARAREGADAAG